MDWYNKCMPSYDTATCANPACAVVFRGLRQRDPQGKIVPPKFCSHACYTESGGGKRDWGEKYKVTGDGRICYRCRIWKTWDNYRRNQTTGVRGRTGVCEGCQEARNLWYTHGITSVEYTWLEKLQGGVCALCGTAERRKAARVPEGTSKELAVQRLCVDHDHSCPNHKSGKGCKQCIRGLLCDFCNSRFLSWVESHPPLRARFEDYLARRPFG